MPPEHRQECADDCATSAHRRGRSGVDPDGPPRSVPWHVGKRASCCYPNLTDRKYPGNPTRSYRTRHPLRVVGGIVDWMQHDPKVLQGMGDHLEELERLDRAVTAPKRRPATTPDVPECADAIADRAVINRVGVPC